MRAAGNRQKISTTVSRATYEYLEQLVATGRAATIAEGVDFAVEQARRMENRMRLARDTATYFASLAGKTAAEETRLEAALGQVVDEISLDH